MGVGARALFRQHTASVLALCGQAASYCMSLRGAKRRDNPLSCGRTKRKGNTFGEYAPSAHFPWYYVLATADARQISACHCEERSDGAIRSPCGSTKPKSNPLGEYEKHYEVALSTTTLPGFSAGTRIATPRRPKVRHAPHRPKASGGATLPWGSSPRKGCPSAGPPCTGSQ